MSASRGAILAVVAAMAAVGPLPEPRHVRFHLADGVQVAGHMTAWDAQGFDGSFGRREWWELEARDAWRLYRSVMDQNEASQWIDLGRSLLVSEDGQPWAQRAFERALALDPSVSDAIDEARRLADEVRRRHEGLRRRVEDERLRTRSPEAGDWPAEPWPVESPAQQHAAVLALRADARQILRTAGLQLNPVETTHFMLWGDGEPLEIARLATRLESVYDRLSAVLGVQEDWNCFWGKAVVFSLSERDRFQMVEAESFGQLVTRRAAGICHPVGPKVFLVFCAEAEPDAFSRAVVRQLVHGYMHRHVSPRRLPPWANEGLAEYLASSLLDGSAVNESRRRALEFVRGGGDVGALLGLTYENGWPDPLNVGPAVGALLIELMLDQRPAGLRQWIRAVKLGKDWTEALTDDYGVPPAQLIEAFVRYYRVND